MASRPVTVHRAAANENPFGPPEAVVSAMAAAAREANRYPESYPDSVAAAVAAHHGVPAEHVAVGAGASGLIQQMLHLAARAKGEAVIPWRSFEAYPLIAEAMGVPVRRVPLRGHAQDLDAMARAVRRRTKLVFVCSPNNPTGTAVTHADLDAFLSRVPRRVFVVLDEVYRDFATDPSTADGLRLYPRHPNLVVLRSFSKSHGLADLRVGYAIGAPGPIAALRGTTMPFLVSSVAAAAARAALAAEAEFAARRERIVEARDRVVSGLRAAGVDVPAPEGNFVWLPLGEATARFADACREHGLHAHVFPGEGVRVTVGDADADAVLLDIAAKGW